MGLNRYEKKQLAVNSEEWTPLINITPRDFFAFRCATSALLFRTHVDDASTEDTLAAGMQETVIGGAGAGQPVYGIGLEQRFPNARFPTGGTVCWIKSVAPTATVIVTWVL